MVLYWNLLLLLPTMTITDCQFTDSNSWLTIRTLEFRIDEDLLDLKGETLSGFAFEEEGVEL
jgi:hypothetical protein